MDYLRNHSNNFYQSYVNLLINKDNIKLPLTATCTPFMRKMFITVNGKILQCEKINHDFAVGQITNNAVNLDLGKVASLYNMYTSTYIEECKTCAVRRHCKRCIYMFSNPLKDKKCFTYTTEKELIQNMDFSLLYLENKPYLYEKILSEVIIKE